MMVWGLLPTDKNLIGTETFEDYADPGLPHQS